MAKPDPDARASERVSLHGLDPEDALRALLAVDPDSESASESESGEGDEQDNPDS